MCGGGRRRWLLISQNDDLLRGFQALRRAGGGGQRWVRHPAGRHGPVSTPGVQLRVTGSRPLRNCQHSVQRGPANGRRRHAVPHLQDIHRFLPPHVQRPRRLSTLQVGPFTFYLIRRYNCFQVGPRKPVSISSKLSIIKLRE